MYNSSKSSETDVLNGDESSGTSRDGGGLNKQECQKNIVRDSIFVNFSYIIVSLITL